MPNYTGLLDMINGGGAGAAGQSFQGNPISGLLNYMGVKPYGYQDRIRQAQQSMQPVMPAPVRAPQPVQAAPMGAPVPPVAASNLGDIEGIIAEMIKLGILPAPMTSNIGYGPR
jgi:hypothetical protein